MDACEAILYWNTEADTIAKDRAMILNSDNRIRWDEALSVLFPADKPLRILDAGCGSGFLTVILAELGHDIVGIDISPVMVQCAYETASALGRRNEYRIMDCSKTDFEDESFDAVICCEVMNHISDVKSVWLEFRRILKKEGHAVILDTGRITAEQAQAQGFSHCRFMEIDGLDALNPGETLRCMSARKPLKDERYIIPQIALFKRHIQTAKKQIQLYQNWCQSIEMPYPEYTVLNTISHHLKGVRPSDISAALVIPPQTLTRILSGLQKDGYIGRKTNDRDHRSSVITITEAGMEKIKPLQVKLHEIEKYALLGFGADELANLNGLSDKLLKSLETAFQRHPGE